MLFDMRAVLLLAAASIVSATPTLTFERRVEGEAAVLPRTNGERFAQGLSPLRPRRLGASNVEFAARAAPSTTPGQCNTGSPACCQSTTTAGALSPGLKLILGLLGVNLSNANLPIGLTCTPLSIVGVGGGSSCNQNPVCCSDIKSSALIGINCVPINIHL